MIKKSPVFLEIVKWAASLPESGIGGANHLTLVCCVRMEAE